MRSPLRVESNHGHLTPRREPFSSRHDEALGWTQERLPEGFARGYFLTLSVFALDVEVAYASMSSGT